MYYIQTSMIILNRIFFNFPPKNEISMKLTSNLKTQLLIFEGFTKRTHLMFAYNAARHTVNKIKLSD